MRVMRQLITRLEDGMHARLKAKAAAEGRSLNKLVTEALEAALEANDGRAMLWARLAADGRRVVPPRPVRVPTAVTVDRITRGAGTSAGEALAAERAAR